MMMTRMAWVGEKGWSILAFHVSYFFEIARDAFKAALETEAVA